MNRRAAVTIVCVWNDEDVRAECLDASVRRLLPSAPDTQYLPVDNRGQVHVTAGSALNQGVREATNEVVVFVHQDVHLHSLVALEEAAGVLLDDPGTAMLGASGITADGEIMGRLRDRVLMLGRSCATPEPVDSLDEVLFMARRADLLDGPVSEHPDLAWHAYAVELAMRARSRGLRVAAVDLPLTHNSMSTNLARLDHAHAALATMYPDLVPTRTTCGDVVSTVPASERAPFLAPHRWRKRWLLGSLRARELQRASGARQVVLADARTDLDRVATELGLEGVRVLNAIGPDEARLDEEGGTVLHRGRLEVTFATWARGTGAPADLSAEPTLVTNLVAADLAELRPGPQDVVGLHEDLGGWLLTGVPANARRLWNDERSRPWRALVTTG